MPQLCFPLVGEIVAFRRRLFGDIGSKICRDACAL
jgi:hypothetical protein